MSLRIGDEFFLNIREQCPKAPSQRQAYGGCTLCLSAAWQLQFLDGHLHGRDDVPSGVAQRPVKVKYDQFYAHCVFFQVILIWGMPSSMKGADDCLNPTLS